MSIIILLILTGSTAYLFRYFCSYEYQLCMPIKNCTYVLLDKYKYVDHYTYEYNYVFNDKYTCSFICRESINGSNCPINGSECHFNQKIFDYCRAETGFDPLVDCKNFGEQILLPSSMLMLSLISLVTTILISITFCSGKDKMDSNVKVNESGLYKGISDKTPMLP